MGFYVLTYLSIAVFIVATAYRIYRQMILPEHVRWEIYPVQHETSIRVAYGGSYMEELNWWTKKYRTSGINELKYMTPEILFLRGLWKKNRSLWLVSFPFHLGLYLMITTFLLLLLYVCFVLWEFPAFTAGGSVRIAMDVIIAATGWTGLIMGNLGSIGILCKRLTDRDMRYYSSFLDYFNVLFIFFFFLSAFVSCLLGDPFLEGAKTYILGLITGGVSLNSYTPGQTLPGALTIVLASVLVAYIPLTHMSHMFMKYFLYHRVKWDDAPNMPGTKIETAAVRNLEFKPTWKAKHVGADGHKSWHDIASSAPKETK
jgi:nitrate reductase gamma subunit